MRACEEPYLLCDADVVVDAQRLLLGPQVPRLHGPKAQRRLALDGRDVGQGLLDRRRRLLLFLPLLL
jgi:hypothetical protein